MVQQIFMQGNHYILKSPEVELQILQNGNIRARLFPKTIAGVIWGDYWSNQIDLISHEWQLLGNINQHKCPKSLRISYS